MHRFWDIRLQKCSDLENQVRGPSRSLEMSPLDRAHTSNFVPKTHRFWDIRSTCKYTLTLTPGLRSLKVIENSIQSGTHDFLLTFHSDHRPISHRFRDKRRFPSKIANFPTPVYFNAPVEGVPLEFGIGARVKKLKWRGYQMPAAFKARAKAGLPRGQGQGQDASRPRP